MSFRTSYTKAVPEEDGKKIAYPHSGVTFSVFRTRDQRAYFHTHTKTYKKRTGNKEYEKTGFDGVGLWSNGACRPDEHWRMVRGNGDVGMSRIYTLYGRAGLCNVTRENQANVVFFLPCEASACFFIVYFVCH